MIFQKISPDSLSEPEAESSYQELSQEQGVKYKQEESNDLKQLTGEPRFHDGERRSIDQHYAGVRLKGTPEGLKINTRIIAPTLQQSVSTRYELWDTAQNDCIAVRWWTSTQSQWTGTFPSHDHQLHLGPDD